MDMSRILIAKTGKTASEWLPLAVHLEDTAGIMQCMIRDMIPPSFPESCALSPEAFEKTAVFFSLYRKKYICYNQLGFINLNINLNLFHKRRK